jgi:hypothetical protein
MVSIRGFSISQTQPPSQTTDPPQNVTVASRLINGPQNAVVAIESVIRVT